MSLLIAALFALVPTWQETPAPSLAPGMRKASLEEVAALLTESFVPFDKDGSGYLDAVEASALEPRNAQRDRTLPPAPAPAPAPGARDPAAERKWMGKLDTDDDGKVSRNEYISYMTPWILLSGVPTDWHPRR